MWHTSLKLRKLMPPYTAVNGKKVTGNYTGTVD
jgi:hypothetical protein